MMMLLLLLGLALIQVWLREGCFIGSDVVQSVLLLLLMLLLLMLLLARFAAG